MRQVEEPQTAREMMLVEQIKQIRAEAETRCKPLIEELVAINRRRMPKFEVSREEFVFLGLHIAGDPSLRPDEVRFRHPDGRTDVFILPDQPPYTAPEDGAKAPPAGDGARAD